MRTTMVESVSQVEDQAAAWLVKRDSGKWTLKEQQALDEWLEASTAHTVAFIRLEALWNQTPQLSALRAGQSVTRSTHLARWVLAAGVLCAFLIASFWYLQTAGTSYRTPVGAIAQVPLVDGSNITLNTGSELRVTLTGAERRVRLNHGEAFFQIAKDSRRPFIVEAGESRVIAVGTAFSVWRDSEDVRVAVTEGQVSLGKSDHNSVLLDAGSVARALRDQVTLERKPAAEIDAALSWRTGSLTFRDTSLADAVSEFNRYNTRKIVIEDDAIRAIRLSGKFHFTQNDAFVRLLERSFPVQAAWAADRIVLTRR
jgi:transmembrane sensor